MLGLACGVPANDVEMSQAQRVGVGYSAAEELGLNSREVAAATEEVNRR
jgi:hypothetical protein